MYVVRNLLKSTLKLSDLKLSIGPREFIDLDVKAPGAFLRSNSLKSAIEEGYLVLVENDQPERADSASLPVRAGIAGMEHFRALSVQLSEIKRLLAGKVGAAQGSVDTGGLKEALVAEMRAALTGLKVERAQVMSSDMDEVEMRARLAMLDKRETELQTNFEVIGTKTEAVSDADKMADLLGDI